MTVKTIKKWEGDQRQVVEDDSLGVTPKDPSTPQPNTTPSEPDAPATEEKTTFEKENESLDYVKTLVTQALELSKEGGYCTVSFDYSQLELLNRSIALAEVRSRQLSQLMEIIKKRKEALSVVTANINAVLDDVKGNVGRLEAIIPEVEIK